MVVATTPIEKEKFIHKPGIGHPLEEYIPLVHQIANFVKSRGLPPSVEYDDLVSDGMVGLMKAWNNFDSTKGVKFETYSSYRIRGEILDGLRDYSPVPYRVQVMIRDLAVRGSEKGRKEKLATKRDIYVDKLLEKKELSGKEFKMAVSRIQKIVSAAALMHVISLEWLSEETGETPIEGEHAASDQVEFQELRERIRAIITTLPKENRDVMDHFFKKAKKQRDISRELKLSRSRVNRVIWRSIEHIREKLGVKAPPGYK